MFRANIVEQVGIFILPLSECCLPYFPLLRCFRSSDIGMAWLSMLSYSRPTESTDRKRARPHTHSARSIHPSLFHHLLPDPGLDPRQDRKCINSLPARAIFFSSSFSFLYFLSLHGWIDAIAEGERCNCKMTAAESLNWKLIRAQSAQTINSL